MEIRDVLREHNFRYRHDLGQNFITDKNLLAAIVVDAGIESDDTVVEIGAGAGSLTSALAERAKRVVSFEVDENLKPILKTVLSQYENVEVRFADVLKLKDGELAALIGEGSFKVVANLPYYVTTPMITRFLESSLNVTDMTLMMQREVADRMTAKSGTAEYGAITVTVNSYGSAEIVRNIDRRMFFPVPKVDSALLRIKIDRNKCIYADDVLFKKVVKSAFLWRRKTLANNLKSMFSFSKEECENIQNEAKIPIMARGETRDLEQFVTLREVIGARLA